jgi:hypothetical protein
VLLDTALIATRMTQASAEYFLSSSLSQMGP